MLLASPQSSFILYPNSPHHIHLQCPSFTESKYTVSNEKAVIALKLSLRTASFSKSAPEWLELQRKKLIRSLLKKPGPILGFEWQRGNCSRNSFPAQIHTVSGNTLRPGETLQVPTTLIEEYYYTHTNLLLPPENIRDFHQHLPDAPNLGNVMPTFQITCRQMRG